MGKRKKRVTTIKKGQEGLEQAEQLIEEAVEWMQASDRNIFLKDFLSSKAVTYQQFCELIRLHPWLEEDKQLLNDLQESKLLRLGLFKELDSNLTKFVLGTVYGYSDKIETVNTNLNSDVELKDLVSFEDDE